MARASVEAHLPLSNLFFHILLALAQQDRHGYAIIKDIESRTGGGLTVRSGALYSAIQRLLESGLIESAPSPGTGDGDRRRKYYRITGAGREVAALEATRLAAMVDSARDRLLVHRVT